MNKIRILVVEGDEVQIKILENYLNENKNIEIKQITQEYYKKNIIKDLLHNLGVPSNLKGYWYIIKAIELLIIKKENNLSNIYKEISIQYNTKISNIESSIRYAIEISWNRGDIDLIDKIFGYSIDISRVKPTNTEYITSIVEIIINNDYKVILFDK